MEYVSRKAHLSSLNLQDELVKTQNWFWGREPVLQVLLKPRCHSLVL